MATISKLTTAMLSMPNELTVAAANFNLDFSLMKVEAPKEFHGVRDALSILRRGEAEEGLPHITARKLGALFEAIVPPIPNLIQAYGKRVSAISSRLTAESNKLPDAGIFAAQAGPDGTSIWAAATSGRGAIAVHLLACMLARIWKSHEAISLWVELVERRKEQINDMYNNNNAAETAAIMAARQTFDRHQLAAWDTSARSWLQTADADRRLQQTQLMLIINNVRLPVNSNKDPYESVIKAWTSSMCAMESLVQGIPQQVQDGAVLLAMSAWHLYPNMEVLANEIKDIEQNDELMNGALITISAHGASSDKEGVFWSLPLGRMRYYSPPVVVERHLASDTSRITMKEVWIVVLGIIIAQWQDACSDIQKCCHLVMQLSRLVNQPSTSAVWLKYLADAAESYTKAGDLDRLQYAKLLGLGMRQCRPFLNGPGNDPPPFFGLGFFPILLSVMSGVEEKVALMRQVAKTLGGFGQDLVIRYCQTKDKQELLGSLSPYSLASAIPSAQHICRDNGEPAKKRKRYSIETCHSRWVSAKLTSATESKDNCNGLYCGCTFDINDSACLYSRMSLERPMQYSSQACFLREECERDCGGVKGCRYCFLRTQISLFESSGERCVIIPHDKIRYVDSWHFSVENKNYNDANLYGFVLGDPDDVAIFKKTKRSNISRDRPTKRGPSVPVDQVMSVLNSGATDSTKLISYLEIWWERLSISYGYFISEQRCSLQALVFASELYKSLKGAKISIEIFQRPIYDAKWAQLVDTYSCAPPASSKSRMDIRFLPKQYGGNNSQDPFFGSSNPSSIRGIASASRSKDNLDQSRRKASSTPEPHLRDMQKRDATSFACIAMFETGELNIGPESVAEVMALSVGDSIFVCSGLISDPSEQTSVRPIQRVFGNLGRSGMAFLIPPSKPKLKDYDLKSWHMVNHIPFDGKFENKFTSTSLHLSFTDFEMPVDEGTRGLRDTLGMLVEALVSVNDRGKHLGDLDIMAMFSSQYLTVASDCVHGGNAEGIGEEGNVKSWCKGSRSLIAIDNWEEFLDLPDCTGIVRASGNWQARLALAAASIQRGNRTLVLPQKTCQLCLAYTHESASYDVIIA